MLSSTTLAVFVDVVLDIQSQGERHCPTERLVRHSESMWTSLSDWTFR